MNMDENVVGKCVEASQLEPMTMDDALEMLVNESQTLMEAKRVIETLLASTSPNDQKTADAWKLGRDFLEALYSQ